jgi:transposase
MTGSLGNSREVTAALIAAVGNARQFKSGRELRAWLGLVPHEHSSGERTTLLGISKRGDRYLRTLLIHGRVRHCVTPRVKVTETVSGYEH